MRSWMSVGAALLAAALAAGCGRGGDGERGAAEAAQARRAERESETPGQRLYRRACIMCHGEGGSGTQLGPALAGSAGGVEEVAAVVRQGVPKPDSFPVPMPPRGDGAFTDQEIATVSEYVASLSR